MAALLVIVLIIIGGGVVRVTGSGLGCPQWPSCTEDSFTSATASTGIHGLIEFANRPLTGVVVLAVGSVIAAVWRVSTGSSGNRALNAQPSTTAIRPAHREPVLRHFQCRVPSSSSCHTSCRSR